jgi:glycine/D-amino acid oxidase-like deaminating enzyme/nitrite reductase/ring-hydroxylating ferredoxin subunit
VTGAAYEEMEEVMAERPGNINASSYWLENELPRHAPLDEDTRADVVVVGGGITGLTAAYLLAAAGRSVVVLERDRCARGDTGYTTAHLTMVTDARLADLVKHFGADSAKSVWDAGLAAIATIEKHTRELRIECGFARVDGYLHAPLTPQRGRAMADDVETLKKDVELAREMGFAAEFVSAVPLLARPGMRIGAQARFHPLAYLAGLAAAVVGAGGRIHEQSAADTFATDPLSVSANGFKVRCDDVVIATHNPMSGLAGATSTTLLQTKLALYTSYVMATRVAKGQVPDALFWDTNEPYHYVRLVPQDHHDLVIIGGDDHKTGQVEDTERCFAALEAHARACVPGGVPAYRWSGQVIETSDGLPLIGQTADHQFSATGFSGNGMTFGTLGGMMAADAILGRSNPWADQFSPQRSGLKGGLRDYLTENIDYPYYRVRDAIASAEPGAVASIAAGEGRIIERDGQKVAAYRDPDGALSLRSAVCPHMGCIVGWNLAEQTWDCPCHGSRFRPTGEVMAGPAQTGLGEVEK